MSADLIARLIEAGTPAHLVAEVAVLSAAAALADQRVADAPGDDTRSSAAIRQKRYRDRKAGRNAVTSPVTESVTDRNGVTPAAAPNRNGVTPNVTKNVTNRNGVTPDAVADRNGVTLCVTPTVTDRNAAPSPNKKSPQTPKKINPTPCVWGAGAYARPIPVEVAIAALIAGCEHLAAERRKPSRPTRIPDGWQPRQPYPPRVAELVAQWLPGREQRELDGFRDFWLSRGRDATKTDWDRTWWNRIRDQHDKILSEARRNDHRTRQDPRRNDRNGGFRDPLLERYAGGGDPEMG